MPNNRYLPENMDDLTVEQLQAIAEAARANDPEAAAAFQTILKDVSAHVLAQPETAKLMEQQQRYFDADPIGYLETRLRWRQERLAATEADPTSIPVVVDRLREMVRNARHFLGVYKIMDAVTTFRMRDTILRVSPGTTAAGARRALVGEVVKAMDDPDIAFALAQPEFQQDEELRAVAGVLNQIVAEYKAAATATEQPDGGA